MKEAVKTAAFAAVAILLAAAAVIVEPERRTAAILSETGKAFYPAFTDPQAVKTIEVVDYDEATASARPFQVEFYKGRWVLPSHNNYVIDIGDRLVKTAGALMDLKKESVVTESAAEHGKYGVIDPLDPRNPSLTGRGKRATLRDARKEALADFVLGKPVEGKAGYRYVRTPNDKRVYAVKTEADPSARFADWVNAGLLRIAAASIRRVTIVSYSIDEQLGRLVNVEQVQLTQEAGQWKMAGGEAFHKAAVSAMAATLDNLRIEDVRPKPPSMAEGLRSGKLEMSLEGAMSMRQRGFFLAPNGRLLANEGEMVVETANGLAYVLRFGEVATSGDAKASPPGGGENRYLFVTVSWDGQRAAKYGDSSGTGERLAREMTNRFADWYYVIKGTDFQKLRLKRRDLLGAAGAAQAAASPIRTADGPPSGCIPTNVHPVASSHERPSSSL
ncbi:MAG: DUF4340 domain-containing protein [Acidobacteria bacterium]|nr:DUF4340 domain-containing protein [Acidobacteriota bacterium]